MKILVKKYLIFILVIIISLISSCESTQQHIVSSYIKSIYLETFDNKTLEPGLENLLTDEVINQFLSNGELSVVSISKADAILKGEIIKYVKEPLIYDASDVAQEYRVRMEIKIYLIDNKTNELLWEEDNIYRDTTYSDVIAPIETELDAQKRVIDELAVDVLDRTIEGWHRLVK